MKKKLTHLRNLSCAEAVWVKLNLQNSPYTITNHFELMYTRSHWHPRCIVGENIMNIIWELTERKSTWNNLLRFFLREYLSFFLLTWVSEWGIETRPPPAHHSAHHHLLLLRQKSGSMIITSSSNQCNTDLFRQSMRRDILVSEWILRRSNASHLSIKPPFYNWYEHFTEYSIWFEDQCL